MANRASARNTAVAAIAGGVWGLARARGVAMEMLGRPLAIRNLVKLLFGDDAELRQRAADVVRRMTEPPAWGMGERGRERPLARYADELAGLLPLIQTREPRTQWHLGLVVAREAQTREQRLRAARLMQDLATAQSVVVRCSGIEGIALLAAAEPALRAVAEETCESALRHGTAAERCRARQGLGLLREAHGKR